MKCLRPIPTSLGEIRSEQVGLPTAHPPRSTKSGPRSRYARTRLSGLSGPPHLVATGIHVNFQGIVFADDFADEGEPLTTYEDGRVHPMGAGGQNRSKWLMGGQAVQCSECHR